MGAQCHENHAENGLKRTQQTRNSAQLPSLWEILSGLCARSATFPAVFAQNWVLPRCISPRNATIRANIGAIPQPRERTFRRGS